ncbi:hypothetical protein BVRB_9g204180 [Beta vulgaris subsp. vulgaris]|nr:hypothetical protein BVRB_9g204180 [Beta vulgaris subsp. vulgaris]
MPSSSSSSSSISMKIIRALNLFRNKTKSRNDHANDNVLLQTITPTLPDHILMEEILPRLPVKHLITFKLVSKQWNHVISSYTFAKSHLKFAYFLLDQFFLINPRSNLFCDWDHFFYLLRYNESSSVNELVGIDVSVSFMFPTLVGCCNGLVCFTYQKDRTSCFCLWNPATRKCRDISNPGGVMFALAYGFGYVSSIDDYKIFSSFGSKTDQFPAFFVFSWKEGKWRSINGLDEDVGNHLLLNSVWIDDTLFWPPNPSSESIVGFNFVSEKLEVYPMMIWSSCVYLGMDLYRLDGCLALFGHKDDEASDFWVLKKHDDWSSWKKSFTVNLRNVSLINFSETGKCLVRHSDQLKLVDVCKEALERVRGDFNFSPMVKTGNYIESLISPYGTTMSDEEELD